MKLYALAVKHRTRDYWTLDQRLFATREATEAWGAKQWGGVADIDRRRRRSLNGSWYEVGGE
jgi:hypothetical protein